MLSSNPKWHVVSQVHVWENSNLTLLCLSPMQVHCVCDTHGGLVWARNNVSKCEDPPFRGWLEEWSLGFQGRVQCKTLGISFFVSLTPCCCAYRTPLPAEGWRPTGTALWASTSQSGRPPCFSDRHRDQHHFTYHRAGPTLIIFQVWCSCSLCLLSLALTLYFHANLAFTFTFILLHTRLS